MDQWLRSSINPWPFLIAGIFPLSTLSFAMIQCGRGIFTDFLLLVVVVQHRMVKITREHLSVCNSEAVRVNGNRLIPSSQVPSAIIAYVLSSEGLPSIYFK